MKLALLVWLVCHTLNASIHGYHLVTSWYDMWDHKNKRFGRIVYYTRWMDGAVVVLSPVVALVLWMVVA